MNSFGFWSLKILDLARIIILAIKTLRIINEDDIRSIIENGEIAHKELDEINHNIEIGVNISRVAVMVHQYLL
jgi:hypothetical protein